MLTSSALSGVGAPGPPGPVSSSMPWEPSTSAIVATDEEQTTSVEVVQLSRAQEGLFIVQEAE